MHIRRPPHRLYGLALAVLLIAGCGRAADAPSSRSEAQAASLPKTMTIALDAEPNLLFTSMGSISGMVSELKLAYHQLLVNYDDRGALHPMLAAELPSTTNGTWVVRPDGSMQTTYRLRQDVRWHDGAQLTARDFVFSWTVTRDADIPMSNRSTATAISAITTPDDFTLVLEWPRTNPLASAIVDDDLGPLPMHLLDAAYRTDKEQFQQLPYWTREFVGVGPFRVSEWEPASHMVLKAFDGFYRGRPKVDTLVVRFIASGDAIVATLLAGSADGALRGMLELNQALVVKNEWERSGKRPVFITQATNWRVLSVQFRPEFASPREIFDPRLRSALLYAIDRGAMVDAVLAGQSQVSETFLTPDDVKWDWVQDVVVRRPYEPQRAQALLAEIGWRPGADGTVRDAAGERALIHHWAGGDQQGVTEGTIVADYWKAIGLTVERVILTEGQTRDNRTRVSFPTISTYSPPLRIRNILTAFEGEACAAESNRWTGSNRSCYQSATADRAIAGIGVAIDPDQQRGFYRDFVRVLSEDLPVLPLYYNVTATIFRDGVIGIRGDTQPRTSPTWNAWEWDLAS